MTRKMLLLLLVLMPFAMVNGQKKFDNFDKLIKHYSKIEGVIYDVRDSIALGLPFIEKLDKTESLVVEDCSEADVKAFTGIDMTEFKGYEVALRLADDEDIVTILMKPMTKSNDEKFSEMVIVVQEEDEGVLVRLIGVFSKPDSTVLGGLNLIGK